MVLLSQSHNCSCYVSTCTTLPTCDITLGWLTLPAPEAGGLVELLVSYTVRNNSGAFPDFLYNCPENCMTCERSTLDIKREFRCLCIACQNLFFLWNIKSVTHAWNSWYSQNLILVCMWCVLCFCPIIAEIGMYDKSWWNFPIYNFFKILLPGVSGYLRADQLNDFSRLSSGARTRLKTCLWS